MRLRAILFTTLLALLPGLAGAVTFDPVIGFATKTGFRAVIAWQADQIVAGRVLYRLNGGSQRSALPLANVFDTAQMAVIDGLPIGATVTFQVEDQLTGATSPTQIFTARNAYTQVSAVAGKSTATINALAQLDAEALPDAIPFDQGLQDLGRGMNVLAERIYDALDGYARIGTILVTDTVLDYPVNVPFGPHAVFGNPLRAIGCAANGNVEGLGAVGHTLADFLIQTTIPFDSHTYTPWMIDDPCTAFYIGRIGQLVYEWQDDLHLGYTMAHEFMHYAFNAPDLYLLNSDANCRNLDWDGSLMHNTGGWNSSTDTWELTELDRNAAITPCDHGSQPYTWDEIRSRYANVPAPAAPQDVFNTQCRGNPDGGAFEVWVLDHEPLSSSLRKLTPGDGGSCP